MPHSVESQQIEENKEEVNQFWAELKELADARLLDLEGAKEIHTFDRDAEDAKERIQVKFMAVFK